MAELKLTKEEREAVRWLRNDERVEIVPTDTRIALLSVIDRILADQEPEARPLPTMAELVEFMDPEIGQPGAVKKEKIATIQDVLILSQQFRVRFAQHRTDKEAADAAIDLACALCKLVGPVKP